MSSPRLAALLGPVIALVLILGVAVVVVRGGDTVDDDFDLGQSPDESPTEPIVGDTDDPGVTPQPTTPAATPTEDGGVIDSTEDPVVGGAQDPSPTTSPAPAPEPSASPTADDALGREVAIDTGGWVGGTPNTGTSVSAVGLPLLLLGGLLLWLRRARV